MVGGDLQIDVEQSLSLAIPGVQPFDLDFYAHRLCRSEGTMAYGETHGSDRSNDENDEHERPRPRLPVPIVIRRKTVGINLQRQSGRRLVDSQIPELIPER